MWHAISVRHDNDARRFLERPLQEHLADTLNELEREQGPIKTVLTVDYQPQEYIELVVRTDGDSND